MASAATPNATFTTPKPLYASGEKLVLAAPAHTGLPAGGNVHIRSVRYDAASGVWLYDILLGAIGPNGTGVKVLDGVREGWLRHEGRIATAKSCAPMLFGIMLRLAPRILVPLYQRRYCWEEPQWRKLWQDTMSRPNAFGPHTIGRVTIARERRAIVLIDGQQRTTTVMLLLCALRDEAREVGGEAAAAPLVAKVNSVLLTRVGKLEVARATAGDAAGGGEPATTEDVHTRQASVGLESLDGARSVRLIPSREDRLTFCSIVLGAPFEAGSSRAAAKMAACHEFFRTEARALLARQREDVEEPGGGEASSPPAQPLASDGSAVETLSAAAESALTSLSCVVFELQDGVALQNIYDMLAQRERALSAMFANVGGKAMSQVDLVRNLLLNHIGDDDERMRAYEESWLPMERAHGDGNAEALEAFLHRFVRDAAASPAQPMGPPPPRTDKQGGKGAAPKSLLDEVAALLRKRGGSAGASSLYAHGANDAGAALVDAAKATSAATELMREMSLAAVGSEAPA